MTEEQRSNRPIFTATLRAARLLPGCFVARLESSTIMLERMTSQLGSTIKPSALRGFPLFADFGDRELRQLLRLMRRRDLPQDLPPGSVVVSEGGPGGNCFIIVSGGVDVTVRVRGSQHLLAEFPAGSIFGQVSLISGEAAPRRARCPNAGSSSS